MRIGVLGALLCLCFVGLSQAQSAHASIRKDTNIPAEPLGAALQEIARTYDLQLLYHTEIAAGLKSQGAIGSLTPDEALTKVLSGTGLSFKYLDASTVTVFPQSQASTPTASSGSSDDASKSKGGDEKKDSSRDFRLAQATQAAAGPQVASDSDKKKQEPELTEIVVTGTHIRGEAPVGSVVRVYSRDDLDQSGAATLDQFTRDITEDFSSVDTIANQNSNTKFSRTNTASGNNAFAGASFDLHGLGPTSTLTLLDGHRLAPGFQDGSSVDISQIPLSIVDHIEVLTDGASAIYGADAVAGVVNIITRKDFEGAVSSVRYGTATSGGAGEFTASQLVGHAWVTGNAYLGYEFDNQHGLDASSRDYIPDQGGPYSLIPKNKRDSVFLSASQELSFDTDLKADALYSHRGFGSDTTASSPIEFQSADTSGDVDQLVAALSLLHRFANDWHLDLDGDFSRVQQSSDSSILTSSAFGTSTVGDFINSDAAIYSVGLVGSGPVARISGGDIKVAVGSSYRGERFDSGQVITSFGTAYPQPGASLQRHVKSAYAEMSVPLVSNLNVASWTRELTLSLAGRYDDYSDFGSTTNPKVGLLWEPIQSVDFRGSFGTSFKAPLLSQLGTPIQSSTSPYVDPNVPGVTDLLLINGGNLDLHPEKSRSWTAGIDLKPVAVPGLTASATYFHVRFSDRISTPPVGVEGNYLSDPALAPFLTRNPSLAEVEAIFKSPGFIGDYAGGGPGAVQAIFDNQFANITSTKQAGIDLSVNYSIPSEYGRYTINLATTGLLENSFQTSPVSPYYSLLNTFGEPTRWHSRGGLTWTQSHWTASAFANYVNGYDNDLFTPAEHIASWVTEDVYFAYKTGSPPDSKDSDFTLSLSITNITNRQPPFVQIPPNGFLLPGQNPIPFDPTNASPVGRLIAVAMTKRW
jgi:outer membrane receptor protein involved in Fe transport